ncbi:MAG: SurA N-terminal domain-containing protein [Thermoanaerobaculia bacterium]|nr:SurA N-terminal domain-containing protein [Thermoanaerobaculia bacterium]
MNPSGRQTSRLLCLLCLGMWVFIPAGLAALPQEQLVDRILAVVDDDPILQSDLDQLVALDPNALRQGESPKDRDQRLLEDLVERRLRFHEVERYGFGDVPQGMVDEQLAQMEADYPSPESFEAQLSKIGLSREDLARRIQRDLAVLTYVDELLGARVFVGLEEIQKHYDTVLLPELRERNLEIPELDEVREQIREVLRQERLNQELGRWTEELRSKADVLIYLDRPDRPLPPVVAETE